MDRWTEFYYFGLKVFYSSQDMIMDQAEQKAMFSSLHYFYYFLFGKEQGFI